MAADDSENLAEQVRERPLRVSILLFPEVEILDFAGAYEVFSVASRVARRDGVCVHPAFEVETIAATNVPLAARHGLRVTPSRAFADWTGADLLVVPGGVVDQPLSDPVTLAWLRRACDQTQCGKQQDAQPARHGSERVA